MTNQFDFTTDWLADAPLSPDQRRAWNMLRGELASAQARNQQLTDQLHKLEQHPDFEPTILTRPDFNREVARMLAFDERYGGMSSVLYFDFDGMDAAVTQFGKSVVNAALREISVVMIKNVRGSDIIGRLAPDEFGVLLMRCDNTAAWRKAEFIAAHLQKAVAEIHGCKLAIKVSYGAYTFRDNEDLAVGLKEAADGMTSIKQ